MCILSSQCVHTWLLLLLQILLIGGWCSDHDEYSDYYTLTLQGNMIFKSVVNVSCRSWLKMTIIAAETFSRLSECFSIVLSTLPHIIEKVKKSIIFNKCHVFSQWKTIRHYWNPIKKPLFLSTHWKNISTIVFCLTSAGL